VSGDAELFHKGSSSHLSLPSSLQLVATCLGILDRTRIAGFPGFQVVTAKSVRPRTKRLVSAKLPDPAKLASDRPIRLRLATTLQSQVLLQLRTRKSRVTSSSQVALFVRRKSLHAHIGLLSKVYDGKNCVRFQLCSFNYTALGRAIGAMSDRVTRRDLSHRF
jgi:hypothetical protein